MCPQNTNLHYQIKDETERKPEDCQNQTTIVLHPSDEFLFNPSTFIHSVAISICKEENGKKGQWRLSSKDLSISIYHWAVGENWLLMDLATLLYFTGHPLSSPSNKISNGKFQHFYLIVLYSTIFYHTAHLSKPKLFTCWGAWQTIPNPNASYTWCWQGL